MAIKNPNPNIKDFEVNDNTTWSSNHIVTGLNAAGVEVGTDGIVEHKKAELLLDTTLEEATQNIDLENINCTEIVAIVGFTYTESTNSNMSLLIKTDLNDSSFTASGAFSSRSPHAANTAYISKLYASTGKGYLDAGGIDCANNNFSTISYTVTSDSIANIPATKIKAVRVRNSVVLPAGTTIKIYGY